MVINQHKVDYKKSFFEKELNKHHVDSNVLRLYKVMRRFGYHYEIDNGRFYVYTAHEWSVKKKFDKEIKPILQQLFS